MKHTAPIVASVLAAVAITAAVSAAVFAAAAPPALVNYQGVLRDASDNPRNGSFEMIFRFFSANLGGDEILVDEHLASGSGAVAVSGGLFGVALGSGTVSDGAGPGTFADLTQALGEYSDVYLQIEIKSGVVFETLSPRTRLLSAAYAQNAARFDGHDVAEFPLLNANSFAGYDEIDEFLTSKQGLGASDYVTGSYVSVEPGRISMIRSSNMNGDVFSVRDASPSPSPTLFRWSVDATASQASLDKFASFNTTGWVYSGGGFFGNGSGITDLSASNLSSGFVEDARLSANVPLKNGTNFFTAANTFSNASNSFSGNGAGLTNLDASQLGTGSVPDGRLSSNIPRLNANNVFTGFFTTVGSQLTLNGPSPTKLKFHPAGSGVPEGEIAVTPTAMSITAGDADTDSLLLQGGNGVSSNGYIQLNSGGSGFIELRMGAGTTFTDFQDSSGASKATVDSNGNVQMDGNLTVTGGSIDQGGAGSLGIHAPLHVLVEADSSVRTMIDKDNNTGTQLAVWFHDGVYANANELMELSEAGVLRTRGVMTPSVAFDLAETFFMAEPLEPGDVVRVAAGRPYAVQRTGREGDPAVLGVVSTRPGVLLGGAPFDAASLGEAWGPEIASLFEEKRGDLESAVGLDQPSLAQEAHGAERVEGLALEKFQERYFAPIALAGRVPVKVDASFGAIEVGDLLAPSSIPGVAMKATKPGPTLGKALEPLSAGHGKILALVNTGWLGAEAPGASPAETGPAARIDSPMRETAARSASAETHDIAATEPAPATAASGDSRARSVSAESVPYSFPVSVDGPVEAGDVLAVDADHPGQFAQARRIADPSVIGIVAGDPHDTWRGRAPLALPGTIVRCKVDASHAAILPGDALVASPTPGYAMSNVEAKPGTVIGKALEPLESGMGSILVLVQQR